MVQRIRLRGHVIRLYGLSPNSSRSRPKACPTCGAFYNDGSNRRCFYLCCEFDDCFDCVINRNGFHCHKFRELCRLFQFKMEVVVNEEKKMKEGGNEEESSLCSIATGQQGKYHLQAEEVGAAASKVSGVSVSSNSASQAEEKKTEDEIMTRPRVKIEKEPDDKGNDKEKSVDLRIDFMKLLPKQWLPLVILERVEKIKEEPVENMESVEVEQTDGMMTGFPARGKRGRGGGGLISGGGGRGRVGRPRTSGGGGTCWMGLGKTRGSGRPRRGNRRRSTRLSSAKNSSEAKEAV